jgi:hypothetical protein
MPTIILNFLNHEMWLTVAATAKWNKTDSQLWHEQSMQWQFDLHSLSHQQTIKAYSLIQNLIQVCMITPSYPGGFDGTRGPWARFVDWRHKRSANNWNSTWLNMSQIVWWIQNLLLILLSDWLLKARILQCSIKSYDCAQFAPNSCTEFASDAHNYASFFRPLFPVIFHGGFSQYAHPEPLSMPV